MTQEECLKIGGHCWVEYSANDNLDENGNVTGPKNLAFYPNGEHRYRRCKHCGKTETLINRWE